MQQRILLVCMLALAGFGLAACDGLKTEGNDDQAMPSTTAMATEPDLVSTRIAQAAEKASDALATISAIDQQRTPMPPKPDYAGAPPNMTQPITIRWTGPIEQIAGTLATRAGLGFRTSGKRPPVPISVTVDVYKMPLIQVLQSIGLQAGQRANLTVDGQGGTIELRYASIDKL